MEFGTREDWEDCLGIGLCLLRDRSCCSFSSPPPRPAYVIETAGCPAWQQHTIPQARPRRQRREAAAPAAARTERTHASLRPTPGRLPGSQPANPSDLWQHAHAHAQASHSPRCWSCRWCAVCVRGSSCQGLAGSRLCCAFRVRVGSADAHPSFNVDECSKQPLRHDHWSRPQPPLPRAGRLVSC